MRCPPASSFLSLSLSLSLSLFLSFSLSFFLSFSLSVCLFLSLSLCLFLSGTSTRSSPKMPRGGQLLCPVCGNSDPDAWTLNQERGSYSCDQCFTESTVGPFSVLCLLRCALSSDVALSSRTHIHILHPHVCPYTHTQMGDAFSNRRFKQSNQSSISRLCHRVQCGVPPG